MAPATFLGNDTARRRHRFGHHDQRREAEPHLREELIEEGENNSARLHHAGVPFDHVGDCYPHHSFGSPATLRAAFTVHGVP